MAFTLLRSIRSGRTRKQPSRLWLSPVCFAPLLLLALALPPGAWAQSSPVAGGVNASAASANLPNLGDGSEMTPAAERRLGDRIARELYRDPDYIDDPVIMDYVQGIWQPLLAAARQKGELPDQLNEVFAWEVLLGKDRSVNAFALPGGYFGLHLGLLAVVTSPDELASVLAHEISHVTQRHIARSMSRQSAQAPWVLGALILGMLAAGNDAGAAQATIVGSQAAALQNQLNYSRDMEREADRIGFGVQTQAGFAPQGFVSMFEKLQQSNRLNDAGGFPYLRSHPLTTERIADMQSRVAQSDAASAQPVTTFEHAMVSARARVLSNSAVDALRTWEQEATPANLAKLTAPDRAGILYGATLAALRQRNFELAQATLERLNAALSGNAAAVRLARLLATEIALAQGKLAVASDLMRGLTDSSRSTLLLRAQTDTLAGRADSVAQSLRTWLADHPRDALAWQALAAAHRASGREVSAVRAEAEVNVAQLDYAAALARFKAAQDMARKSAVPADQYEASIVDARARQMESLLKEQALER